MIIALSGFMASGKSYFGKAAADALNLKFVDLDKEIECRHGSVDRLFSDNGEQGFRKLETETLEIILNSEEDMILALGGGTPLVKRNGKLLKSKCRTIWLDTSWEIILSELDNSSRPLIKGKSTDEVYALYKKRRPLYEENSDYSIRIDSFDYASEAEALAEYIRKVLSL